VAAIKDGNDALAKEALKRKRDFDQLAKEFKLQFDDQAKSVQFLKGGLTELETKLAEAKRKKDILIARQKRAQAQKAITESMSGMSKNSAFAALERMENRVKNVEAHAEAIAELESEKLETRFASLEKDDISEELAKLKAKIKEEVKKP